MHKFVARQVRGMGEIMDTRWTDNLVPACEVVANVLDLGDGIICRGSHCCRCEVGSRNTGRLQYTSALGAEVTDLGFDYSPQATRNIQIKFIDRGSEVQLSAAIIQEPLLNAMFEGGDHEQRVSFRSPIEQLR